MLNPALPFPYIVRISNSFFLEIWFKRGGMEMAKITQNLHQQVGERWANALRRRFGANAAKRFAADFNVNYRTAHGWLSGRPPYAVHYIRAWELFGLEFINETLNPRAPKSAAEIKQAFAEVRRRLEDLKNDVVLLIERSDE